MEIVFHCNMSLTHQREHASWFRAGLKKHGLKLTVTSDIKQDGDIHIVSGPHYAANWWQGHDNVIMIDRELYHPDPPDCYNSMPWVSVGWLRADGSRHWYSTGGKKLPLVFDKPATGGTIFLADYNGPYEKADTVRLHPAERPEKEPLGLVLRRHTTAIGYRTSALVKAGLHGLDIICKDKRSIMSEKNWLELLPYADWNVTQFKTGELWNHLSQRPL